jgi:membrane protease YdiL (CAAX protease family)
VITLGVHQGWLDWLTKLMDDKPDIQDKVKELQDIKDWGGRLSFMFTACVLAPVAEEMVFRGFLYPALKRFAHPWIAATVVAAMFAVIHLSLGALLPLFVLSLLLTLSYEWTGSLAVPVFVHAAFNLTNVILTLWGPHAP